MGSLLMSWEYAVVLKRVEGKQKLTVSGLRPNPGTPYLSSNCRERERELQCFMAHLFQNKGIKASEELQDQKISSPIPCKSDWPCT